MAAEIAAAALKDIETSDIQKAIQVVERIISNLTAISKVIFS